MNILLAFLVTTILNNGSAKYPEKYWTQERVITTLNDNILNYIDELHAEGYRVCYMRTDCVDVSPNSDVSFNITVYDEKDENVNYKVWMTYHFENGYCTNFYDAYAGGQGNICMDWVEDDVIHLIK